MIDSIKIKLISNTSGNLGNLIYSRTSNVGENRTYGNMVVNCSLDNLKISCVELEGKHLITITGSLHKFFKGDNLSEFTFDELKQALQLLADKTGLNILSGIIKRIDFGANIPVKNPVTMYNLLLTYAPRYVKDTFSNYQTVTFRKKHIALTFYDKIKQIDASTKKKHYRSISLNKNVIRYELKLLKRLAKTLNHAEKDIYVYDLINGDVYKKLTRVWYKEYRSIIKLSEHIYPDLFNNFHCYLESQGVTKLGGISEVIEILDKWCKYKDNSRQAKYNIKSKVIAALEAGTKTHNYVIELNKKIRKIKKETLSSIRLFKE